MDAPNTYRLLRWLEFGDASSQYFSNYDQATLLMCVAIFRGAILVAVNILWKALQKLRSIVECFKALYTAASHFPLQLSGGNLNSYILIQTLTLDGIAPGRAGFFLVVLLGDNFHTNKHVRLMMISSQLILWRVPLKRSTVL